MKKILNYLVKPMLLLVLIAFTGCEKDLYEDGLQNSSRNLTVKKVSLKDIDISTSTRINEKISLLKKSKSDGAQERFEYNSTLEVFIDTENGKLIDNDGKLYYTFPMFRESEENLENIIFVPLTNGEIETYFAKYNVKPEEYGDLTYTEIQDLNPELQKVFFEANEARTRLICVETQILIEVEGPEGVMDGNPNDTDYVWQTVDTECTWVTSSSGGTGGDQSGNGVGGNTSGGHSGGGTTGGSIYTGPVSLSPEQLHIKDFIRELDDEQETWYVQQPQEVQNTINLYITNSSFSLESKNFAKQIIDIVKTEVIVDNAALNFVFQAKKNDKIYNDLDDAFLLSVDNYMDIDVANYILSNPTDPLWIHFTIQCAVLRANHPTWSDLKIYWEASKEMVHIALDALGLVPVFGEVADLTNGALYLIEGDGVNATLSLASAVPIAGWAAVSTKYAIKVVNQATTIGTKIKLVWRVIDNVIDFGNRSQLRKVLGITASNIQAHHLMPWALRGEEVIQRAARSGSAFHMNEALNGIAVAAWRNQPNHTEYNNLIKQKLDIFWANNPNATPQQCYVFLTNLIAQVRTWVINNPSLHLNDIILP